jgi:hypothetical protein
MKKVLTPKKDKYHSVTFETKVQSVQTIMYAFIDFGNPNNFKNERFRKRICTI